MLRNCKEINFKKDIDIFCQIKKVAYEKRLYQFVEENVIFISK